MVVLRTGKSIGPFDAMLESIHINGGPELTLCKTIRVNFLVGIIVKLGTPEVSLCL